MTNNDNRTRFTFRIPDKLFSLVKKEADDTGVSVNAQVLYIIKRYFEDKEVYKI